MEDRAGNISEDYLLDLLLDRQAPAGTVSLHPDSDTEPRQIVLRIMPFVTPVARSRTWINAILFVVTVVSTLFVTKTNIFC